MSKRQSGNLPCFIRILRYFVITIGASEKYIDEKLTGIVSGIYVHIFKEEVINEFTS
jgi:hypothetical protein